MLIEQEGSLQKPIKTDNLGSVFIPCGDGVEVQVTVNKVWESALHASACQGPFGHTSLAGLLLLWRDLLPLLLLLPPLLLLRVLLVKLLEARWLL